MTDRSKLLALAEAVEKLTGPDREVDREILQIVKGKQYRWAEFGGMADFAGQKKIAVEVEPEWLTEGMHEMWFDRQDMGVVSAYTASLDAAMTLVPEGWRLWTGDFSVHGRFVWTLVGPAAPWTDPDDEREYIVPQYASGIAATPALALCAAALRAQAEALS